MTEEHSKLDNGALDVLTMKHMEAVDWNLLNGPFVSHSCLMKERADK